MTVGLGSAARIRTMPTHEDTLKNLATARAALELARMDVVAAWMALTHDSDRERFWNRCVSVDPTCREILGDDAGNIADWYAVCDVGPTGCPGCPPGQVHAIFREYNDAVEFQRDTADMTTTAVIIKPFRFQGVMRVE